MLLTPPMVPCPHLPAAACPLSPPASLSIPAAAVATATAAW